MEMKVKNKQIKKPMLKSRQAKALALSGLMGVAGLMASCPAPVTSPTSCPCVDKVHLGVGETCSCADICDCKEQKEVLELTKTGKEVLVSKDAGVLVSDFNRIVRYFDLVSDLGYELQVHFGNNIKEIRIKSIGNLKYEGRVLFVNSDERNSDVIWDFIVDEGLLTVDKGGGAFLSVPRSIKLAKDFGNAKNIVRTVFVNRRSHGIQRMG